MDYTTLARFKSSLNTDRAEAAADKIAEASRAIDKHVAGSDDPDTTDYFKLEAVTDELLAGQFDVQGRLLCYPHKSRVSVVSAIAFRTRPGLSWTALSTDDVEVKRDRVRVWSNLRGYDQVQVKISYTGGHGATPDDLPDDLQRWCTVMAVRYFKEDEAGLSDVIGVSELGTPIYSKAMPQEVMRGLLPYRRTVAW